MKPSRMYAQQNSKMSDTWIISGHRIPKSQCQFFTQTFILFFIIIAATINISLERQTQLWQLLMTVCIGAALPCPTLKREKRVLTPYTETVTNTSYIPKDEQETITEIV
jgi:hypothetical protein